MAGIGLNGCDRVSCELRPFGHAARYMVSPSLIRCACPALILSIRIFQSLRMTSRSSSGELEQHCLVNRKVDLGHPIPVLIGHQQHTSTLHPECTGLEGLVVFLIIVQHIADQPLLGLNATRGLPIGSHFQFHARFFKIGAGCCWACTRTSFLLPPVPMAPLPVGDTPGLVNFAQRFTHRFLSTE